MNELETLQPDLDRIRKRALLVGGAALGICIVGAFPNPDQFFRSYLVGYLFWIGIALGSLAILMLHQMVGGAWGFVICRTLESATRTLPLMGLLFVPLLFGMHHVYVWARPEAVAADELLQHKSPYLNFPFFATRAAIYFTIWIGIAYFMNKWSAELDRAAEPSLVRRLQRLSGPGLLLYGLTVSFAFVDWVMSLEPHWFSTVYGVMFMIGQALGALAFAIVVTALLVKRKPLSDVVAPSHFHDLGNLLLAFVMLWAYIAFSQYLIIWSGNLPEEIPWYLQRSSGGWQWVALLLFLFHFCLPFLVLLSRGAKRRVRILMTVAATLTVMRLVELFWLVAPAFHPAGFRLHWMDLGAPIGIGGIWIALFVWQLGKRALLPVYDPRLKEALGVAEGT